MIDSVGDWLDVNFIVKYTKMFCALVVLQFELMHCASFPECELLLFNVNGCFSKIQYCVYTHEMRKHCSLPGLGDNFLIPY